MDEEFKEMINEFRHSKEFCDAKIIVENGKEFWVHRVIVSACSNHFRALFTTKLNTTSVPGEYVTTSLEWVSEKIMKVVIDYAYTKELAIDADTVYDVYIAVDYLRIDKAVTICAKYLIDHLTNQNCIKTYDLGNKYHNPFIVKESEQYILYNFSDVSKENDDILEMTLEYVVKLLSSEHLYVLKEEEIWEFALRWVKAHEAIRKDQLSIVMREIRFGIMDWDYFVNEIKNHPFVRKMYTCKEIISETEKLHNLLNTIPRTETPKLARHRISHCVLFAIGHYSNDDDTNAIEVYDPKADRWSQIPNDSAVPDRINYGTVYLNNKIYMIGGDDPPKETCRSCHSYDLKTDQIFVTGGSKYNRIYNTAEVYDPELDRWSMIPAMFSKRCFHSCIAYHGCIYALGGTYRRKELDSVERFDPNLDRWIKMPPMNIARTNFTAQVIDDAIIVMGGSIEMSAIPHVELYDISQGRWRLASDMNMSRSGLSSCVVSKLPMESVTRIYRN